MSAALHERIRRDIEARILSGALRPGDRLRTEHALMADYGCARMTVSKALSALAAAGLVERRRGAGSFVARPRLHSLVLDVPDLRQQVLARGQPYRFRLIERVPGAEELELRGVHYADERELAVEHRTVSLRAVPEIVGAVFDSEPPGSWLLRRIPWTEAETRIAALAADPRTAALLQVEPGAPLLAIERRTWRGTDAVTHVRQWFRADAYDLVARFGTDRAARPA